jgi:hypothetical protein
MTRFHASVSSRFAFPDAPGDLIGAHLSTRGGLHTVFERATAIDASAGRCSPRTGINGKARR